MREYDLRSIIMKMQIQENSLKFLEINYIKFKVFLHQLRKMMLKV